MHLSRFVPRLRRRSKLPDYSERSVFGIPVAMTEQHYGQPLPQCILFAMRYLRRSSGDSVGIFRKPGVRMRVQALRVALETDPGKFFTSKLLLQLMWLTVALRPIRKLVSVARKQEQCAWHDWVLGAVCVCVHR